MNNILTNEDILALITILNGEIDSVCKLLNQDNDVRYSVELNDKIQTSIRIRKKLMNYLQKNFIEK